MTFQLSEQDWLDAKEALTGKPNGTKLSKYPSESLDSNATKIKWLKLRNHAFVIIDNIIYALSNNTSFMPTLKNNIVLKKGVTLEGKEVRIMKKYPDTKPQLSFNSATQTQKNIYTVIAPLTFAPIFPAIKNLTPTQKRILSLRACIFIGNLSKLNIVHGKIKAENFVAHINGNNITLNSVNPCFSYLIADNLSGFQNVKYLGIEKYSVSSDAFSLALMLLFEFDINCSQIPFLHSRKYREDFSKVPSAQQFLYLVKWIEEVNMQIEPKLKNILLNMLKPPHLQKPLISQLILYLCEILSQDNNIDFNLNNEVNFLITQYKPRAPLIFTPFLLPDLFSDLTIRQKTADSLNDDADPCPVLRPS